MLDTIRRCGIPEKIEGERGPTYEDDTTNDEVIVPAPSMVGDGDDEEQVVVGTTAMMVECEAESMMAAGLRERRETVVTALMRRLNVDWAEAETIAEEAVSDTRHQLLLLELEQEARSEAKTRLASSHKGSGSGGPGGNTNVGKEMQRELLQVQ
jgi:hypothetical protein